MKFGKAFSDSVVLEKQSVRRHDEEPSWWLGVGRALVFISIGIVVFAVLFLRLFHLTVVEGHTYRRLADENRTRELIRHAPRGILRDRTGAPLVENIARPENYRYDRTYLYPEALAHAIGYMGELSEKEFSEEYYVLRSYHRGDQVGRTGAEAVYEEKLRGRDGRELVEVDAEGNTLRSLGRDPEISGQDVLLTFDARLSETAALAFPRQARGAVVVSKPQTGEILTLYSSPSFSPNAFTLGMSSSQYEELMSNPDRPMFSRAIGGVYPPGSTFKMITATAGLEEGAIAPDTTIEDTGIISIGPFSFSNWFFTKYGKTDGLVNIVKAIQRSNDIFFYKLGQRVGITKLATWARKFGLGKPLGIELAGEAGGLMPDADWKKQNFTSAVDREARNDEWYTGDTYHVAIGQGYILATPLQVNSWTNVIANTGKLCRPTIEKETLDRCKDLGIKQETISLITQGMIEACSEGGTGWPLFGFKVPVACKTGTAEFGDPNNRTHAWFTVFAPATDPEISVTVLVEGAGEGSDVAAPIAKKILEEWFSR